MMEVFELKRKIVLADSHISTLEAFVEPDGRICLKHRVAYETEKIWLSPEVALVFKKWLDEVLPDKISKN